MRWKRWAGPVAIALLAAVFAYLNAGERVAVNLGVVYLYRLPLSGVVFGVFLLGMVAMFLLGIRHDLRVRRALEEQFPPHGPPVRRVEPPPESPP
ncbi:MAG TPA: hypothetical protein VFI91_08775 [Longimicrobiaceae bacterium]|nr:hypothetical protein [Longimicrobiaceae bacterium]